MLTRTLLSLLLISACLPFSACCAARGSTARFVPAQLPPMRPGSREVLAVVLRWEAAHGSELNVSLRVPRGISVAPRSFSIGPKAGAEQPVFFKLTCAGEVPAGSVVTALVGSTEVGAVQIGQGYDLEAITWKASLEKDGSTPSRGWTKPEFDDSGWGECQLPSMWNDTGVTCLRARLFVPNSWRGRDVYLRFAAIDDNDVCYLNGVEVGRTNGWDRKREYLIPPSFVKFGEENLLCVAVNNMTYGGGIYRSPSSFGIAEPSVKPVLQAKIAPAAPVGRPLPLRPMRAVDGVLRYEGGGEVALWGVNYYPQSWYQFDNMKRLGVDMNKAIRDDLDDMLRMGVQVIRIHIFDREISDGEGNLVDNEHLDLLDYLVSEGTRRGIYFMFTPIAWWGGPNENPDSFSARTPKQYMFCDPISVKAQANYLRNWLNHTNRYTGRRYKDEPAICALEIHNEPAYADYNAMMDPDARYYNESREFLAPFKERLRARWREWCSRNGIEGEKRFFPLFRYQVMSDYLETMFKAIRHTGARQPIACALFDTIGQGDLTSAIADSRCEAVTTGGYAGAWDKVGDGVNYLPYADNHELDPRLNGKVRLVYEFDGIKTFGSYLYPALARRYRNMGVQIACMFQYDSSTTAEWNTDWDAHYLNLAYTPGKAVSFRIGGRVFSDLPRGAVFPTAGTTQRFGNCLVSFDHNISVYSGDSVYLSSAPYSGAPLLDAPRRPKLVMGVGDSPFASYAGTGIYTIDTDYAKRRADLTVNPDAEIVGDPWRPRADRSAVVLKRNTHHFTLNLTGVKLTRVTRKGEEAVDVALRGNTFEVTEGEYELVW